MSMATATSFAPARNLPLGNATPFGECRSARFGFGSRIGLWQGLSGPEFESETALNRTANGASNSTEEMMKWKGQSMKRFTKILAVAALAASVAAVTAPKAEAFGGWAIGGAAVGGLAVGAVVGSAVTAHAAAPYYVYPGPVVAAPVCAPAAAVVVASPVCVAPVVIARPHYYRPFVRVGFGWGRGYHYRRW